MDAVTIELPKSLDIAVITSCFEELKQSTSTLSENVTVTFDAKNLISIDTTGLQLLVAIVIDFSSRNIQTKWLNTPQELTDGAHELGLDDILKLH